MTSGRKWRARAVLTGIALYAGCTLSPVHSSFGYSVIMHEAIIDAEWDQRIQPFLLKRFPQATPEELREAKSYAYGGAAIQDMGYYPLAGKFFSHLTHYARSGDFVGTLLAESQNINDYAFALGALSHYSADNLGHSLGVNRAVPLLYPRLRRKYGNLMTWEDSPYAHVLTEFAFDTLEVVAGHVAPQKYHESIGFRVPEPLLRRAFQRTYGLDLPRQTLSLRVALWAYRNVGGRLIPEMTEVAWALKGKNLEERAASVHHRRLYHIGREDGGISQYPRTKPGPGDKVTAFFFRLIPKFGPLNAFQFHTPTEETEQFFADSLRATIADYAQRVKSIPAAPPNTNLDTGRPTAPGDYRFCDGAYAKLLHKLERTHFVLVTPELRSNLLVFYGESENNVLRKNRRKWRHVLRDLKELKAAPTLAISDQPSRAGVAVTRVSAHTK